MRKLLTFLIALAVTAGVSISSFGGSMMLTGVGRPPAAGVGPPTLTFTDNQTTSGSGTGPFTATLAIGTASANRRVYILLMDPDNGQTLVGTPTIGGVSADINILIGNSGGSGWVLSAVVPSGTTAVLSYNTTNSIFATTLAYAWTTDTTTLSSITPVTSYAVDGVSNTSFTSSVATLSGGAILMGFVGVGITNGTQTISASDAGLTQRADFGSITAGDANGVSASAANHVTMSWTTSSSSSQIFMVALR